MGHLWWVGKKKDIYLWKQDMFFNILVKVYVAGINNAYFHIL